LNPKTKRYFEADAREMIVHILALEGIDAGVGGWSAKFIEDSFAREGDVRDIVLRRRGVELGISCKSNHRAFRHSRISPISSIRSAWRLGKDSLESPAYLVSLNRAFAEVESPKPKSWSDLGEERKRVFYNRCIRVFGEELRRLAAIDEATFSRNFFRYVMGSKGYYKCVVSERFSFLQGFLFGRSVVARINCPKRLVKMDFPSDKSGVLHLYFDRGISFSLRLHNASDSYERSLKFDIQAIGLPQSLYTHHLVRRLKR